MPGGGCAHARVLHCYNGTRSSLLSLSILGERPYTTWKDSENLLIGVSRGGNVYIYDLKAQYNALINLVILARCSHTVAQ
jgi:hypothetical protein